MKNQNIEYQHFSNLVERVAVYTERLENVCRNLEQYKVEIKDDIKNIETRVKVLENSHSNYNMVANVSKYLVGAIVTALIYAIVKSKFGGML